MAFLVGALMTPDFEDRLPKESFTPLWITNATELLPRVALCVNASLPKWRIRKTGGILSCTCWQIWLQGYDDYSDDTDGFVMPPMFQCKIRVPLYSNDMELKPGWGFLTSQSLLPPLAFRYACLSLECIYSYFLAYSIFTVQGKANTFTFLTSNKAMMYDFYDSDQNWNLS